MYVCVCVCVYACVCVHVSVCVCVCIYKTYIDTWSVHIALYHIYGMLFMHAYIYIYIYIWKHSFEGIITAYKSG